MDSVPCASPSDRLLTAPVLLELSPGLPLLIRSSSCLWQDHKPQQVPRFYSRYPSASILKIVLPFQDSVDLDAGSHRIASHLLDNIIYGRKGLLEQGAK